MKGQLRTQPGAFRSGLMMAMIAAAPAQERLPAPSTAPAPTPAAVVEPVTSAQPAASAAPSIPFSSGETLHYEMSWRLFRAGEASIHVQQAQDKPGAWEATIKAYSTGFVSKLFKVDDTFVSRFTGPEMCSESMHKTVHEGRRHRDIRIDFHKDRKVASIRETDLTKNQLVRQVDHAIPECAFDVLSAFFHVRTRPLEVGKSFQMPINDGVHTLSATVEVQAKEEVKTPAGTFRAIRVEPKVFGGTLFKRSGRMQIWLSDDPLRLMIQLKARMFWGTLTGSLQRVERK